MDLNLKLRLHHRLLSWLIAAMLCSGFVLAAPTPLQARETVVDAERLLVEAWTFVREDFHDPRLNGVDWRGVLDDYFPRAGSITSRLRAHELINEMVAELGASHTALLERRVYDMLIAELGGDRFLQGGVELEWRDRGFFVRSLHEGGAAERAGLMLGDRVVSVDGMPPERSGLVADAGYDPGLPGPGIYYVLPDDERPVEIVIQRSPSRSSRRTLQLVARRTNCLDTARDSVRVVRRGGYLIGTVHMWFLPGGGMDRILRQALRGKLSRCDALILDMRGRGGYDAMGRRVIDAVTRGSEKFDGPVVALMDERTRSAKELFAERFRDRNVGTLVGTRTEGAVIGAKFRRMSDGSVLMIGGHTVRTPDGRSLEGVGVEPDVLAPSGIEDYAQGYDPIFETGVDVAVDRCRKRDPRYIRRMAPRALPDLTLPRVAF